MGKRIYSLNYTIERPDGAYARYSMLKHIKRKRTAPKLIFKLLDSASTRWTHDGLNETNLWRITQIEKHVSCRYAHWINMPFTQLFKAFNCSLTSANSVHPHQHVCISASILSHTRQCWRGAQRVASCMILIFVNFNLYNKQHLHYRWVDLLASDITENIQIYGLPLLAFIHSS